MRRAFLLIASLASIGGCSTISPPTHVVRPESSDWRTIVTDDDRSRLAGWRQDFVSALADARNSGHGAEIDREGLLLEPDAALTNPAIPEGLYRCRTIKLGAKTAGMLSYVSYPAFGCQIGRTGAVQTFSKLTGSQRQVGGIFPRDSLRSVFLGTLVLGDETRALAYGTDEERDVAGYLERIGAARWRLVMPSPHFESKLDVLELVPE